jgi:TonB family protein
MPWVPTSVIAILLCAGGAACWADTELRISERDGKKAAIEKPAPAYPIAARQLKVVGTVTVEAQVTATGGVEKVQTVTGNPILAKSVHEAVGRWKFTPFESEGKPARAIVTLSFEFGAKKE